MYVRHPNYRYPNNVRVPDNYAGNAFQPSPEPEGPLVEEQEIGNVEAILENNTEPSETKSEQAALLEPRGFRLRLGSLFGKGGNIGTEELLILALILLLADGEGDSFDDIILFLALLFFIR